MLILDKTPDFQPVTATALQYYAALQKIKHGGEVAGGGAGDPVKAI